MAWKIIQYIAIEIFTSFQSVPKGNSVRHYDPKATLHPIPTLSNSIVQNHVCCRISQNTSPTESCASGRRHTAVRPPVSWRQKLDGLSARPDCQLCPLHELTAATERGGPPAGHRTTSKPTVFYERFVSRILTQNRENCIY